MRYLGGKSKIAKRLAGALLSATTSRRRLVEPFIGGGAMTAVLAPHFESYLAADLHEDLILMWRALAQGWEPPRAVSEAEYRCAKNSAPSPLRGFIGFGPSWGGKWFGGYARGEGRNYADEPARSLLRDIQLMKGVEFICTDYRSLQINEGDIVYCDPPYATTTEYRDVFDSKSFWEKAREWSDKADVFVSEFSAPPGWVVIAEIQRTRDMRGDLKTAALVTEKMFKLEN
jgi:DNA adenine methylase